MNCRLVLDLGSIEIYGLKSHEERPLILSPSSKSSNAQIHIEFELAPIDKTSDYRFVLLIEPMTIVYHAVGPMKELID